MIAPCPKCGSTTNKPGARFCSTCGAQISGPTVSIPPPQPSQPPTAPTPAPAQPTANVPPSSGQMLACPRCGTPNRIGAKFCKSCRGSLTVVAPPPVASTLIPTAVTPTPLPSAPTPKRASAAPLIFSILVLTALTLCLCVSLFGVVAYDSAQPTRTPTINAALATPTATIPPEPTRVAAATLVPTPTSAPPNPSYPVVSMKITKDGRFGFMTKEGDPSNPNDDNKPLTFRTEKSTLVPDGHTNNTRVSVDGKTPLFGETEKNFLHAPALAPDGSEMSAAWEFSGIVFTQTVRVAQSAATNRLGIFRIGYAAMNRDTVTRTVGLRLMIDTLIGDNDGVPFNIPGHTGLTNTPLILQKNEIPDSFQVYENPDLNDPGVIVQWTLSGGDATPPDRLVISQWCKSDVSWDYFEEVGGSKANMFQCGEPKKKDGAPNKLDSAAGIFFDPQPLAPGETRAWTTYYGLGEISKPVAGATSALALVKLSDRVQVGDRFWVTALVQNPKAGQKVKIDLPAELKLARGNAEQSMPEINVALTQISWLVEAAQAKNDVTLSVTLSPEASAQSAKLSIALAPTSTPTRTPVPCTPSVTNPLCK